MVASSVHCVPPVGIIFIESSDDAFSLVRHPVVPHQLPQKISADTIESLFEIYEVDIQGGLSLDALLHNNPQQCCYLIRTASAGSEARVFPSHFVIQRDPEALQDHFAKHLTCHVQQHNTKPLVTVAPITPLGQLDCKCKM